MSLFVAGLNKDAFNRCIMCIWFVPYQTQWIATCSTPKTKSQH